MKWEKGKDEREKKGARRKRNGDRPHKIFLKPVPTHEAASGEKTV